jgi:hypothetical protein
MNVCRQCPCAGDVVIIVPYAGQLASVRQALAERKFSVLISEQDREQLAQVTLEGKQRADTTIIIIIFTLPAHAGLCYVQCYAPTKSIPGRPSCCRALL